MRVFSLFLCILISCAYHPPQIPPQDFFKMQGKTHLDFKNDFWKNSQFHYTGEVELSDSSVILHRGGYMTGMTWHGPVMRDHYKIEFDARRIEGMDFFCGLTFPIADEPCSLILGGWGGYTTGLSSINGLDAGNNETMNSFIFENATWYHISLWIETDRIHANVNDYEIFDVKRADKTFSVRYEVEESIPLGIATFNTTGEIQNFSIERLQAESRR